MKTIEERAEEHWAVEWEKPNGSFKNAIIAALTELAADLNAEKEKEVAELREKLAAIEAGSDIQNLSVSSHFELDCGPIKTEPALLDEVKRVLAMAENRALDWDMLGRAHGNSAVQMWREDALKLLTRLSHE